MFYVRRCRKMSPDGFRVRRRENNVPPTSTAAPNVDAAPNLVVILTADICGTGFIPVQHWDLVVRW